MALPLQIEQQSECRSCELDLRHCHGTALVGSDETYVCTDDPDCTLCVDEHWYVTFDEDEPSVSELH